MDRRGMVKRDLRVYVPLMAFLILAGLPARAFQEKLPYWYTQYFGDFLWAMLIYFLCATILRMKAMHALLVALSTTYLIEISQLFRPDWLEYLRSLRICALVLGYGFLWSDLVAYALGICLGAIIDTCIGSKWTVGVDEQRGIATE